MKEAKELVGQTLEAIVFLNNYTYPRSKAKSGEFAIVKMRVKEIISGEIPEELADRYLEGTLIITVSGNMPRFEIGMEYRLTGKLVINKKYGPQYECQAVRLNYNLDDLNDQKNFFSFFMSDRMINLLFSMYDDPIKILANKEIGKLTKIKGIGVDTAMKLCTKYEECKNNGRAYARLKDLGLTKKAIDNLVKRYGSPDVAIDKVTQNPYILIKEVRGYGWKKADALALQQGFTRDCRDRVLAYTRYYLEEQGDKNGNSWVLISDLLLNVSNECAPVTKENLYSWIKECMVTDEELEAYRWQVSQKKNDPDDPRFLFYKKDGQEVGLLSIRIMEKKIAENLIRLKEAELSFHYEKEVAERLIGETEKEQGYEYTDEQKAAVYKILDNNVVILTGAAGTGKSSSMLAVTRILSYYGIQFAQCALSGRASSNLSEITGCDGMTIHRLLRYLPDIENFAYNARHPLPQSVIVLDEVSMVGGDLFLSLIEAIRSGSKLIMIGDPNQLESIGLCNILKDSIQSGYIPVASLTKIHRQAAKSGIIVNANLARTGTSLIKNSFLGEETRGDLRDFKIVATNDSALVPYNIEEEYKKLLSQKVSYKDIQIIVPMKLRGPLSCRAINTVIQPLANPYGMGKGQTVECFESGIAYQTTFNPGDRIIVNHNDYKAKTVRGEETSIFNGNIGFIVAISSSKMIIKLQDQEEEIELERESWFNVSLAYAITCHKSQGTGIPYVIFGLNSTCYVLYSRELVYTAITRAKRYCVVCTQPDAINKAVHMSRVRLKQTWLKDDLHNEFMKNVDNDTDFDF